MSLEQNMDMIAVVIPFLQCDVVIWLYVLKNLAQSGRIGIVNHFATILDNENQRVV